MNNKEKTDRGSADKLLHNFFFLFRQAVIAFQNVIIMSPQGPYSTTYLEINKNEKKTIGPPTDRGMSLLSRVDKRARVLNSSQKQKNNTYALSNIVVTISKGGHWC